MAAATAEEAEAMTGLLIALVVLQSISLLLQISHAGAMQRLVNLASGRR